MSARACMAVVLSLGTIMSADGGLRLECKGGNVSVLSGASRLATYSGLDLVYSRHYMFSGGSSVEVPGGYQVTYSPPGNFPDGTRVPVARGSFVCTGGIVRVRFTVEGADADGGFRSGLCMFARRHEKRLSKRETQPVAGYWVRDPNGGLPWEEALGRVMDFTDGNGNGLRYVFAQGCAPNPKWGDPWRQHLKFAKRGDGAWESEFMVQEANPSVSYQAAALVEANRSALIELRTSKTYNWFENPSEPLSFLGKIVNANDVSRAFDVSWCVRGFEGPAKIAEGTRRVRLAPGASCEIPASFETAAERGLYFVEMSARDAVTGREAFARTSLARLPPHRFRATPANSPFGLAAYWPIPDEESVQRLMDRMGVMWIRGGDTRKQHPPRVAKHISGGKETLKLKGEAREKWIADQLETCRTNLNEYWEFCNELNMAAPGGIALKTHGIGKAVLAPAYAEFVKDIARVKKEKGSRVRLLSLGLAGHDRVFLRRLNELGAWACLDGICVHPGRGNFTVDYPYLIPERAEGEPMKTDDPNATERLSHSSYWNYLGTVRGAQRQIRDLGDKPLWLTEIYAPTFPNSWWEDSPRCSAENVVMTYAFIKADGVACGMWYQLFDTVWYDKLGINPAEREYFFGLLNRDLSFKPALMAYCTIAEALDEAEFLGWLEVGRDTAHAMAFQTPRGTMAIAWDRSEGFILNRDHLKGRRYASPEPWVEQWAKSVEVSFPVTGEPTCVNVIGQARRLASEGGMATVRLTGAPTIVYGLDRARLTFYAKARRGCARHGTVVNFHRLKKEKARCK